MTDPEPQTAPAVAAYPKAMYRAIILDGKATVYYDDHGETKIHPQCFTMVQSAEGEALLDSEGWKDSPQAAYDALAGPATAPVVTALQPDHAVLGSPSFLIHVIGTGFAPDAVIVWNGADEPTTVVSATELTTGVNMETASAAATVPVAVKSGGVVSNALDFTFTEAATRRGSSRR